MPGPAKRPTALTEALGNPGKRKKNRNEPKPPAAIGAEPPEFLDQIGRNEWNRVSAELLNLGLLTTFDTTLLSLYCQAVSDFHRFQQILESTGEVYTTPAGILVARPEVALRRNAFAQITKLCAEFGFSPSARARMNVTLEQRKPVTLEDILNGTAKGNVH